MRTNVGWIYREEASGATPRRIRVTLNPQGDKRTVEVFDDNAIGAEKAAEFVTKQIGNNWQLEDMQFLGYRIVKVSLG